MEEIKEAIISRLADGESLSSICRGEGMPAWSTVHRWMDDDQAFVGQITRAREVGYLKRADDAILAAKTADDAARGRLAFDAERWYLGKLSNAFSDKQKHEHSGGLSVEVVKRVIHDPRNTDSEDIHPTA